VSRFDAEIGDQLPGGSTLSQRAWLEAMQTAGWTEFAADGWVRFVRWVSVAEALASVGVGDEAMARVGDAVASGDELPDSFRRILADEEKREAADPCHGCIDRHLDQACCCIIPRLPHVIPRRVRADDEAMLLLDAAYEEPATERGHIHVAYGPLRD
jgi:hypothetical protein